MTAVANELPDLDGHKEIAEVLRRHPRSVQRYAARDEDPLPVEHFGRRVMAWRARVLEWYRRNFGP